jgi:hypothetical protein
MVIRVYEYAPAIKHANVNIDPDSMAKVLLKLKEKQSIDKFISLHEGYRPIREKTKIILKSICLNREPSEIIYESLVNKLLINNINFEQFFIMLKGRKFIYHGCDIDRFALKKIFIRVMKLNTQNMTVQEIIETVERNHKD